MLTNHFIQLHIYFNVRPFQFLFILGKTPPEQQPLKMKGLYLVEPVVALYAFSSFLMYPLIQQYVYRRLWQELTNSTFPASDNISRCAEPSSNQSSHHEVRFCFVFFAVLLGTSVCSHVQIFKNEFVHFSTNTCTLHRRSITTCISAQPLLA